MLHDLKKLSHEENLRLFLQGTSYASFVAYSDKDMYEKAKDGKLKNITEYQERDIAILSLLESLGYPMDDIGTYLYKDVIADAYNIVKEKDLDKTNALKSDLKDIYSNFYRFIARDDKEMGILTFHLFIEQALNKVNKKAFDSPIAESVLGKRHNVKEYGENAFKYASYLSRYLKDSNLSRQKELRLS